MAPRAQWKGYLTVGEISCAVALYTAASTAERTRFHTVNKATGNRVKREFVDEKSGKPVSKDDQVKGFELEPGHYVILEQDEIDAVIPESDKRMSIEAFISCGAVDTVYFDKPYFLAPADDAAQEAFALIRTGMEKKSVAALATAVLFRRQRSLMIRPFGKGLVANILNYDYEVRSAEKTFRTVSDIKVKKDMLDLASHIIDTMSGDFAPQDVDDRYEAALAELVSAKVEGRKVKVQKPKRPAKVVDLMDALRKSADAAGKASGKAAPAKAARKSSGRSKKAA